MSGYYVACPRCANQLYDDGQLSGDLVMCPRCGQQFQMPAAGLGSSPAVEIRPAPSPTRSSHQRKRAPALPVYKQLLFGGALTIIGIVLFENLRGDLSFGLFNSIGTQADNDLVIEQQRLQSRLGDRIDLDELKKEWRLSRREVIELGESIYRLKVAGMPIEQIKSDLAALRNVRGTAGMLEVAPDYASMRIRGADKQLFLQRAEDAKLLADIKRGAAGPVSDAVRRDHKERTPY